MEQQPLFNALNFSLTGKQGAGGNGFACNGNPANTTVTYATLSFLLCPSDMDRLTNREGHINYCFNWGSKPYRYSMNPSGPFVVESNAGIGQPYGAYGAKVTRLQSITDGLSQTAAMSERVKGIGNGTTLQAPSGPDPAQPTSLVLSLAATTDADVGAALYRQGCMALNPSTTAPGNFGAPGGFWQQGLNGNTAYTHVMTPNTFSCAYGKPDNNHPMGALTASSRHPGVVNVLFCDGSTRAIKSSVNPQTWWGLGSMAGGEVVSSDSY
jgi:prepilin-type processing-associated H-X9-DG protein